MIAVHFSETISAFPEASRPEGSCTASCQTLQQNRCKNCLYASPGMKVCHYQDSIVAYVNCTKRRYKSSVDYKVSMVTREFGETCYLRPRYLTNKYTTRKDINNTQRPRWYTSSVDYQPMFTNSVSFSMGGVPPHNVPEDCSSHPEDEQDADGQTYDGYAETGYGSGGDLSDISDSSC